MAMTGGERFKAIFEGGSAVGLGADELLRRFAHRKDEAAFSALVERHGPMVLATCRRILGNPADADDAFQATFLVLARKARAIEDPNRLAPWLHGVARRVSVRSRSLSARRKEVENEGSRTVAVAPPPDDARELRSVLDEELARLPEKYRVPLVLCYLEGMTHDEAAEQLRWPVGTVRSRMAQARDRLRSRLARRGFAPESVAILTPATLPMAVVSRTLQVATVHLVLTGASGVATKSVAAALLAQGVLTSMFLTKAQTLAVATLAVATTLAAGTAGVVAQQEPVTAAKSGVSPPADAPKAISNAPASPRGKRTTDDLRKELDSMRQRVKELESALKSLLAERGKLQQDVDAKAREIERAQFDALQADDHPRPTPVDFASVHTAPTPPPPPPVPNVPDRFGALAAPPAPPAPPTPTPVAVRGRANGTTGPSTMSLPGGGKILVIPPEQDINLRAGTQRASEGGKFLVIPPEQDRVTIVDMASGSKKSFRPAGDVSEIAPDIAGGVVGHGGGAVGLGLKGPRVTQLAVYSIKDDEWFTQDLREPILNGGISPLVHSDRVEYRLGRTFYIFTPGVKRWGVHELTRPLPADFAPPPGTTFSNERMMIPDGDALHVFTYKTGEWTQFDIKDDK